MGFAKYHEDNIDMWVERNRDQCAWLPRYTLNNSLELNKKNNHGKITNIPTLNRDKTQRHPGTALQQERDVRVYTD